MNFSANELLIRVPGHALVPALKHAEKQAVGPAWLQNGVSGQQRHDGAGVARLS